MKIGARVLDLYGWMLLLGPSGPNEVSRSQTPRSRIFLRFHDFRENEVLLLKSEARVLDLWLYTSSGHEWPKFSF